MKCRKNFLPPWGKVRLGVLTYKRGARLRPFYFFQPVCKPGSVGFHHLSCHVITGVIIRPTPRHRTSSPLRRYTWSFNPWGVRLPVSPQEPVSSCLAFSPFPLYFCSGGFFLLHLHILTDIFPLGSMVLCIARTFLPRFGFRSAGTMEQPAAPQS